MSRPRLLRVGERVVALVEGGEPEAGCERIEVLSPVGRAWKSSSVRVHWGCGILRYPPACRLSRAIGFCPETVMKTAQ